MNRKLMFGIAVFFAVVGLALTGSEKQVQAGWGCHGGLHSCGGGLFSRLHARSNSCCGEAVAEPVCAPAPAPSCGGGGDCGGGSSCHGGLFARWRARRAARHCGGAAAQCCGAPAPVCASACDACGSAACGDACSGAIMTEAPASEVPAAPAPEGA